MALIPAQVPTLVQAGVSVLIETGAGGAAGYPDPAYLEKGARILATRAEVFASADLIATVRFAGANPAGFEADLSQMRADQMVVGLAEPLSEPALIARAASKGIALFALELIPRITKAQAMDVLSSMATVAGYKAVLLAAASLPRMFPMLTTAAGTLQAARVFVVGAGVAGLQAIATARRLGAVVEAYDVRPAVREQVQSLGARFVALELDTSAAEGALGYARELGEEFYRKQREMMARVVAQSDVVITTAAVPGQRAPILITAPMIAGMRSGSVIVDLAAERGGNCEVTRPGETVQVEGVTVIGPLNLPATVPYHASQMFSKNLANFIRHIVRDGRWVLSNDDEITASTLVTRNGEILEPRVRERLAAAGAAREGG